MLGGIGVWSVTRVFVRQKIRSVAILKCVGATTRQVLATYVLQVVLLGLAGSLLGVGARRPRRSAAIPASLTAAFGGVPYGLTRSAVVQGLAVGLLVSLLFSLVPLLEVRRVKPLLLLRGADAVDWRGARGHRQDAACRARWQRIDWAQARDAPIAVGSALVGVAAWQAASWQRRRGGLRRLCGRGARAPLRRVRRSSAACGRSRRRRGSRCATPSSACAGRATRRASSCSPSGSAASSCSACARCRAT